MTGNVFVYGTLDPARPGGRSLRRTSWMSRFAIRSQAVRSTQGMGIPP